MSEVTGNPEPTSGPTRKLFEQETQLDSRDPANKQTLHTWLDQYDKRIAREKAQKQHPSPSGKINMGKLGDTLHSEAGETPDTNVHQELVRNERLLQAKKETHLQEVLPNQEAFNVTTLKQHADLLPLVSQEKTG